MVDGGNGTCSELLYGEPFALELEGHAVAVEVFRQHGLLTASLFKHLGWVLVGFCPHAMKFM